MYKGRLRAVYEPMFLQKHPPLGQATRLPSSRERTTGARAPRPLSPASAPLHAQSTTKVDPVRYQSRRIDPSARGSKDRATAGWRGSSDGATADARESSNQRRGGGASIPAAPAKKLTCRVLASQRGSRDQPRTTALMGEIAHPCAAAVTRAEELVGPPPRPSGAPRRAVAPWPPGTPLLRPPWLWFDRRDEDEEDKAYRSCYCWAIDHWTMFIDRGPMCLPVFVIYGVQECSDWVFFLVRCVYHSARWDGYN
jgi:hypothetical protein